MAVELTVRHWGRMSQVTVRGNEAQRKKLRDALLLKDFIVVTESDERLEMRRRASITQDDWPMRVIVRCDSHQFDIRYFLFIPWGWIVSFVVLMWLVLPFAGIRHVALAFGLAAIVAMMAIYKQKFDCRPDARFWQARPRQRWHEIMEKIIREAFTKS